MCFYSDYDWYASVSIITDPVSTKPKRCEECGARIHVGDTYHSVYQQEHEACHSCEQGECLCPDHDVDGHECKCEEPDFGEAYAYHCCANCHKFLQGVKSHEVKEGCRPSEALPALTSMIESLSQFEPHQITEYAREAARLHPELIANGYMARVLDKISGYSARDILVAIV